MRFGANKSPTIIHSHTTLATAASVPAIHSSVCEVGLLNATNQRSAAASEAASSIAVKELANDDDGTMRTVQHTYRLTVLMLPVTIQ